MLQTKLVTLEVTYDDEDAPTLGDIPLGPEQWDWNDALKQSWKADIKVLS